MVLKPEVEETGVSCPIGSIIYGVVLLSTILTGYLSMIIIMMIIIIILVKVPLTSPKGELTIYSVCTSHS